MANEQNLKPVRTKSEASERGRRGGKASGKARQERKQLKDELLLLLQDGDAQQKMCTALLSQAKRGNIKAFEVIRDTIGEKPIENIEISQKTSEVIDEIEKYVIGNDQRTD